MNVAKQPAHHHLKHQHAAPEHHNVEAPVVDFLDLSPLEENTADDAPEIPPAAGSSGLSFDIGEIDRKTAEIVRPVEQRKADRLAAIVDKHFPYGKNERALSTDVRAVLLALIQEI